MALRRWPRSPLGEDFLCTVKAGPAGGLLRRPSSAGVADWYLDEPQRH